MRARASNPNFELDYALPQLVRTVLTESTSMNPPFCGQCLCPYSITCFAVQEICPATPTCPKSANPNSETAKFFECSRVALFK